ncbi:MAG: ParB-like protein [Roseiarcus sp.]|uniref:ParB-like protein n=1 Tax=Roseiarcus sp. TaxID=1969460 RepID=UPI003C5F3F5C
MTLREPVLHTTPILSLRPTQITLGMVEVHQKRDAWRQKSAQDLTRFLESHMVPTIVGLGGAHYLIDHHHLARALYETGVESVFVTVVADLSRLTADHFWNMMDFHGWTHPYDGRGRRRPFSDLPRTVRSMEDDPYRSLAGELRTIGGFAKDSTPFSEFLWADFLRPRIKLKAIKADFNAALSLALALSKTPDADYLPGWCGPKGYVEARPAIAKAPKPRNAKAA